MQGVKGFLATLGNGQVEEKKEEQIPSEKNTRYCDYMKKKKAKRSALNVFIDAQVYDDFSVYCTVHHITKTWAVEQLMKKELLDNNVIKSLEKNESSK